MQNNWLNISKSALSQMFNWEIYAHPHYFWLLCCIPLFFVYAFIKHKKDFPKMVVSKSIFTQNLIAKIYPYLAAIFYSLTLIFAVFALARPQDERSWNEFKTRGIDMVISMDISTSMLARDFKPNRLEASKQIATEFVLSRSNDRFGLVIFAGESFTQCPLTVDHKRLVELFDQVGIGLLKDGTAIGSGLATAVKRLKDSDAKSKVIILLSDGENNSGDIAPQNAAKLAQSFGIKVYTIAVGTNGKAEMPVAYDFFGNFIYEMVDVKIDEKLLQSIANQTGGQYFRATNNNSLREIYKEIDALEKNEIKGTKFYQKTELFFPFLMFALLTQLIYRVLRLTVFKSLL
jgi:Ca-activated chloride channel family protein